MFAPVQLSLFTKLLRSFPRAFVYSPQFYKLIYKKMPGEYFPSSRCPRGRQLWFLAWLELQPKVLDKLHLRSRKSRGNS